MKSRYRKFLSLAGITSLVFFTSGCIRFFGGAGYVSQKPMERTEHVVGFDTAQAFQNQQAKGNVST